MKSLILKTVAVLAALYLVLVVFSHPILLLALPILVLGRTALRRYRYRQALKHWQRIQDDIRFHAARDITE